MTRFQKGHIPWHKGSKGIVKAWNKGLHIKTNNALEKYRLSGKINQPNKVLIFNGFNVYRFWEHEINESVENCFSKLILNALT